MRWLTPSTDIAALVVDSAVNRFEAELFHFGNEPRRLGAELMLLEPGDYLVTVAPAAGGGAGVGTTQTIRVDGPRSRVAFELPARQLCKLTIVPAGAAAVARLR